jgi:hypothetical protein
LLSAALRGIAGHSHFGDGQAMTDAKRPLDGFNRLMDDRR